MIDVSRIYDTLESEDMLRIALLIEELKRHGTLNEYFGDETILSVALSYPHTGVISLLVENGVDLDVCAESILHHLSIEQDDVVWQALLEVGFDASKHPLPESIASSGNVSQVAYLLKMGVDINTRIDVLGNEKGYTYPLHVAVSDNNYRVIYLMLHNGADLNAFDSNGKSVYDMVGHPVMLVPINQFLAVQTNEISLEQKPIDSTMDTAKMLHTLFINMRRVPSDTERVIMLFEACTKICFKASSSLDDRALALDIARLGSRYVHDIGDGLTPSLKYFETNMLSVKGSIPSKDTMYVKYYNYLVSLGYGNDTENALLKETMNAIEYISSLNTK